MTIFTDEQLRSLEQTYKYELEAKPKYDDLLEQLWKATTWKERIAIVGEEYRLIDGPNKWYESAIKDEFGVEILPELQQYYALGLDCLDCVLYDFDDVMETNRYHRTDPFQKEFNMPFDHLFFFGGHGNGDLFGLGYKADGSPKDEIWLWDHETDERRVYCHSLDDLLARYFSYYGGYGEQLTF